MSEHLLLVQVVTALWLTVVTLAAAIKLVRGNGHAALVLTCVHFVFFGVPLWLDVSYGGPSFTYPGFADAADNVTVSLMYCFAVAVAPLLWDFVSAASAWTPRQSPAGPIRLGRIETVVLFLPLLLAVTIADPATYMSYGAVAQDALDDGALSVHLFVSIASLITVALIARNISRSSHLTTMQRYLFAFAGSLALWLNGKRAIIVIATVWIGTRCGAAGADRRFRSSSRRAASLPCSWSPSSDTSGWFGELPWANGRATRISASITDAISC